MKRKCSCLLPALLLLLELPAPAGEWFVDQKHAAATIRPP